MTNPNLAKRPMKFWEVTSAFRLYKNTLSDVFSRPEWQDPYLGWFHRLSDLVLNQNREVLDAFVPLELSREIAKHIPDVYYFDCNSRNLRLDQVGMSESDSIQQMTTLEVHDQFGGAFLEKVQEYGSARIPNVV